MHVVALSDQDGEFVEFYEYDAYGAVTVFDSEGDELGDGSAFGNDHFFTGRRYDRDLELYYYRNRWYDPHTGRFLSRDPLGLWGDSLNLGNGMGYVGQSPWNYVDPLGLEGSCTPRVYNWNTMDATPMGKAQFIDNFFEEIWDDAKWVAGGIGSGVSAAYNVTVDATGSAVTYLFDTDNNIQKVITHNNYTGSGFELYREVGEDELQTAFGKGVTDSALLAAEAAATFAGGGLVGAGDDVVRAGRQLDGLSDALKRKDKISDLLDSCPTNALLKNSQRFHGVKPKYQVNTAHLPGYPGWRRNKTKLPADAEDVYRNAVPDDEINPRNWYGKNAQGQIYRYGMSRDGHAHFNGIDGVGDGIRNMSDYAKERLKDL